jgi:hypothetical protein
MKGSASNAEYGGAKPSSTHEGNFVAAMGRLRVRFHSLSPAFAE